MISPLGLCYGAAALLRVLVHRCTDALAVLVALASARRLAAALLRCMSSLVRWCAAVKDLRSGTQGTLTCENTQGEVPGLGPEHL